MHIIVFFENIGINHYHLFANISKQINNNIIIDLGTYRGFSALAFSYNPTNIVYTYDVEIDYAGRHYTEYQDSKIMTKMNINRKITNIFTNNISYDDKDILLKSSIIFMDAGDHCGKVYEEFLISFLKNNNYKGLVIWDDIYLNNDMRTVWNSIPNNNINIII